MESNSKMIQKYALAEITKCQLGTNLTEGPTSSKHITSCSTGGAGNLNSNTWAQYFIDVFQNKIKNPFGTTSSNPSGLLNSGPTRNAGEIVLVGWNRCQTDPCFLIRAAYDEDGSKKDLETFKYQLDFKYETFRLHLNRTLGRFSYSNYFVCISSNSI